MIAPFFTLVDAKIIWFYFTLFVVIVCIKKIFRIHVALNSIWFSVDGNVPEDAIQNLLRLANEIKKSPYRRNYQIYFWTDTKKLHANIKKKLKLSNIKIQDYRCAFLGGTISAQTHASIDGLLRLGDENNKVFFVLASDIFRLYLLLKFYPAKRTHSYSCYFDCNDIEFNYLPHPRRFKMLKAIAFHFVEFNYTSHSTFPKLVYCNQESQRLLTNDVIITCNQRNNSIFFNELYQRYYDNLNNINHTLYSFMETLHWTRDVMKVIDDDLVVVMIFTTTHMINCMYAEKENPGTILSLTFMNESVIKTQINGLQDAEDFISFERDYDKGFTCLTRDKHPEPTADNALQNTCREFWYRLFQQRYALINNINNNLSTTSE